MSARKQVYNPLYQSGIQYLFDDSLNNLSDVVITNPVDNELLAYDSSSGNWINQTPSEAGLDLIYLKLDGSNANTSIDIGIFDFTTTGLGTFGNLDVDTLNFNGNVISDSTGTISFDDENLTTTGIITASKFDVVNTSPTSDSYFNFDNDINYTSGATDISFMKMTGAFDVDTGSTFAFQGLEFSPTFTMTDITTGTMSLLKSDISIIAPGNEALPTTDTFNDVNSFSSPSGTISTCPRYASFNSNPNFSETGGSNLAVSTFDGVRVQPTASTAVAFGDVTGMNFSPSFISAGSSTLNGLRMAGFFLFGTHASYIGVNLQNVSGVTNTFGIFSSITSGANKYFLRHTGSADSLFRGDIQIDADNKAIVFGAFQDSSIYWNNSNMIVDPDLLTAGARLLIGPTGNKNMTLFDIHVNGDETIDGEIYEKGRELLRYALLCE